MGEFSRLDRRIAQAEREYLQSMGAKEDFLERYFEEKRKKELSKKNIKDLTWSEIEILEDERKSKIPFLKANEVKRRGDIDVYDDLGSEDKYELIQNLLTELSQYNTPYAPIFAKLQKTSLSMETATEGTY